VIELLLQHAFDIVGTVCVMSRLGSFTIKTMTKSQTFNIKIQDRDLNNNEQVLPNSV